MRNFLFLIIFVSLPTYALPVNEISGTFGDPVAKVDWLHSNDAFYASFITKDNGRGPASTKQQQQEELPVEELNVTEITGTFE